MSKCKVFSFAVKISLKIIDPAHADKIIEIIESESDNCSRRKAFMETTYQEMLAGANYSSCKTIKDISNVYATSLLKRLGY